MRYTIKEEGYPEILIDTNPKLIDEELCFVLHSSYDDQEMCFLLTSDELHELDERQRVYLLLEKTQAHILKRKEYLTSHTTPSN